MKIFNWVHKKFHHNTLKDGFAQNAKKTEPVVLIDAEKQALLEQVSIVDVLDGWKGGILTIGTFGFDPLKPFTQQKLRPISDYEEVDGEEDDEDYFISNEEDEENDSEDESEVNPLVFSAFGHAHEEEIDAKHPMKPDMFMDEVVGCQETMSERRKKKGERITLADLFLADADDVQKKQDLGEVEANLGKKQVAFSKSGLSFAKKLIPRVGEDSRPIKKLHRLMRRMLKRKIHPELEGKANKTESQMKPGILEILSKKELEAAATESVSLLQTPDAIA